MLENTYKIDPAFNKDLVLAYQPPPVIDSSNLPTLSKHWLDDLQKIICAADSRLLPNCLTKHLGSASDYQAKSLLREQLQLIYHRLQGHLDFKLGELSPDNHQALICKLTEEINSCSGGFHNRVNIIVDSFQQPRNLDELLYMVRKRLVENVATYLSNEVHAWNRFSVVAAADGLGIKANLSDDIHSGNLAHSRIRQALQKMFASYFTPFFLPTLLITAFKELIPDLEVEKQSENGLSFETQEHIKSLIKQFLPEFINENSKSFKDPNHWKNYFEVETYEENPFIFKFVDINCEKLYQAFYYTLLNNNYFTTPKINTLLENAYYNLFLNKDDKFHSPEPIISKLFYEHQYYSLLTQLVELKAKYPIFYQEKIDNPRNIKINELFVKNCLAFTQFLTHQLAISEHYSKEITQGFQLILHLSLPRKVFIIQQIARSLLVTNKANFNLLMLGALNDLELVKAIFNFLKKNEVYLSPEIAEKMLLMKNSDHCNALMIAANKQKEAIITILGFLKNYIGRFANDTLYKLFTQQQKEDSYTALTLAARDNPDLLSNILGFFTENIRLDSEIFRKLLFPEDSNGACTALMLAIKNQADSSLSILMYISKNIKSFDNEVLKKMFLEKDENGFNILMLAAQYHPGSLTALLRLLERKLFTEEFLISLFLEKNSKKYNFLMLAAEYQPETIATILKFISKKESTFNSHLINLLFDKNPQGYNSLMLSRYYSPAMMSIIDFVNTLPKPGIPLKFPEIFSIKNVAGLNLLMLLAKDSPQSLNLLFEFIERNSDYFTEEDLLNLFQHKSLLGYNCLMLAVRNQMDTTEAILNFILKKPKVFSPQFIDQYIAAQDNNRANALMIAAIYQPKAVGLLLDFLTMNIAPKGPISIDTVKKVVFEKVHDKEAANAVFFGGRYSYYKSVLLVLSKSKDHMAANALLRFIDHHIESLGIEVFVDLLTEKDYQDKLIFGTACFNNPGIMKKTLHLLANSATHEALIPVQELCAKFIFTQLAQWTLETSPTNQRLFDKVVEQCSEFLLIYFNKDFFAETPHNLKRITDKLFSCYLEELNDRKAKKIHYTTNFSFFKWRYSTTQKLEAALALQEVLKYNDHKQDLNLSLLKYKYPAVALCRLGKLFAAYQEIAKNEYHDDYSGFNLGINEDTLGSPMSEFDLKALLGTKF